MFAVSGNLISERRDRKNANFTDFLNFSVPKNFPLPRLEAILMIFKFANRGRKESFVSTASKLPVTEGDVTAQPRLDVAYDYKLGVSM